MACIKDCQALLGLTERKWSVVLVSIFCLSIWGIWALEPVHKISLGGRQVSGLQLWTKEDLWDLEPLCVQLPAFT